MTRGWNGSQCWSDDSSIILFLYWINRDLKCSLVARVLMEVLASHCYVCAQIAVGSFLYTLSPTFLIVISLEGLINFIHYIVLRKYCFLFPGKRNLESTAWGCWSLCDFAPVNFPWSHLSSAAFCCCCFRSFLAQSGGLNSVCEGDREREWWCAEAWDDSPRSSPASLEWPLGLQWYGCNLFTARDLVCDLSFAIELYNKKQEKPEQRDH